MRTHFKHWVLLLLLVALFCLGANAQSALSTVVPLGVPALTNASAAGQNQACGIGHVQQQRGQQVSLQMVDFTTNKATTLVSLGDTITLTGVACPQGQVWFTAIDKATQAATIWKVTNGQAIPFLKPGEAFGGFIYTGDARLVGNANRAIILGQFGNRTMAFNTDGQLIMDYGDGATVFESCATQRSLVATVQFRTPFATQNLVTRAQYGYLESLGYIPDLGNDGSQNTALLNLTHTVGCNANTAAFMIRMGSMAVVQTVRDQETTAQLPIFYGANAGDFPISNIWGLTLDADDNVSFAMNTPSVPGVYSNKGIFAVAKQAIKPVALEGVNFAVGSGAFPPSDLQPFALNKRLLFFVTPMGGGYEIEQ